MSKHFPICEDCGYIIVDFPHLFEEIPLCDECFERRYSEQNIKSEISTKGD